MAKAKKLTIFYSWQSDRPAETNLNAIRNGLRKAAKQLRAEFPDLDFVIDEATRDTSGAVKISDKIIEKLEKADIIVADITSVTGRRAARSCPNPNVTFELGYGVAQVGWERVILLFNKAHGRFPTDMPFDFQQNRATPYELAEGATAEAKATLAETLRFVLKAIVVRNPKRPAELKGLSPERIAHDRDTAQMKWLMSALHLPTVDEFILELPHRVRGRAIWFWEGFRALMENSLFELYDPELREAVDLLHTGWSRAFSHVDRYNDVGNGDVYAFNWPHRLPERDAAQADWNDILDARDQMRAGLDRILARLRADYLKVDIDKTNRKAHRAWVEDQQGRMKRRKKTRKKRAK